MSRIAVSSSKAALGLLHTRLVELLKSINKHEHMLLAELRKGTNKQHKLC